MSCLMICNLILLEKSIIMINYDSCSTICTLVVKILCEGIQILVKEEKYLYTTSYMQKGGK